MHFYSFNIKDYRKDTAHLTPMEHYIYRFLMDWYYMDEEPITLDEKTIMRRLSLRGEEHQELLSNVLEDFFTEEEDGYHHKRIDKEIAGYQRRAETNRKNGKKGGRPPKKKPKETQSVNLDNPKETEENQTLTQNNLNQEPGTRNHEPFNYNNNNNDSNSEDYFQHFSVKEWEPERSIVSDRLSVEAPSMNLSDDEYQRHLNKFKNFYFEREVKGEGIATEERGMDLFIDWLKREQVYENKSNATANSKSTWDDRNYQQPTVAPSSNAQPYNPQPQQQDVVRDATVSAILNGAFFAPLPGMSPRETEQYVFKNKKPGELSDEAYYRIISDL